MIKFYTDAAKYESGNGDTILYPFGPPIFQTYIDPNFTKDLISEGRKLTLKDNDWNHKLAGNLKYGRSYLYKKEFADKAEPYLKMKVEKFFDAILEQYENKTPMIKRLMTVDKSRLGDDEEKGQLKLDSFWINFSQKHDYNPPHNHSGILSFVIFCKVPREIFSVQADSNAQRAGNLHFTYGEKISELMGNEYPVEPFEHLMFIFPAELKHFVSPYWVDAERISVSGNFIVV